MPRRRGGGDGTASRRRAPPDGNPSTPVTHCAKALPLIFADAARRRCALDIFARDRFDARMRPRSILFLTLTLFVAGVAKPAAAVDLTILTRGKSLRLVGSDDPQRARGVVRVGADPALADAPDPTCPSASTFELGLFTGSANAVVRGPKTPLDCAKWKPRKNGWVYQDAAATGGVRAIFYGPSGVTVKLVGANALPAEGPIAYAFMWLEVGGRRYHGRFHQFRRNDSERIISQTTPRIAAEGERGFWAVLTGDDDSEAAQQATLAALASAGDINPRDGRSRFLLGMLHLYRFGQMSQFIATAPPAAVAELRAAVTAFAAAEPLLWDRATRTGDSRVPGFGAAARYALAVATNDSALREQSLADFDYALEINAFFNVFDLMTVLQAEPANSPAFQSAFAQIDAYLAAPSTFQCAFTQPEVCTGNGLGPGSIPGTFTLFGDVYAKAGRLADATRWYDVAKTTEAGWALEGLAAARSASAAARVAAYQDADPSNDPPIIGAGAEACRSCHHRVTPAS